MSYEFAKYEKLLLTESFALDSRKKFLNLIQTAGSSTNELIEIISSDENLEKNIPIYVKKAFNYKRIDLILQMVSLHENIFAFNKEMCLMKLIELYPNSNNVGTIGSPSEEQDSVDLRQTLTKLFMDQFNNQEQNSSDSSMRHEVIIKALFKKNCIEILTELLENNIYTCDYLIHAVNGTSYLTETDRNKFGTRSSFYLNFLWVIKNLDTSILDLLIEKFDQIDQTKIGSGVILTIWCLIKKYSFDEIFQNVYPTWSSNLIDIVASISINTVHYENGLFLSYWLSITSEDIVIKFLTEGLDGTRHRMRIFASSIKILGDKFPLSEETNKIFLKLTLCMESSIETKTDMALIKKAIDIGIDPETLAMFVSKLRHDIDFEDFVFLVGNCTNFNNILQGQLTLRPFANQIPRLKYLLENGANPNLDNGYLLFYLVFELNIKVLKLLIDFGGDINLVRSAIEQIQFQSREEVMKYFSTEMFDSSVFNSFLDSQDLPLAREICLRYVDKLELENYVTIDIINGNEDTILTQLQQEIFDEKLGPNAKITVSNYSINRCALYEFITSTITSIHYYDKSVDEIHEFCGESLEIICDYDFFDELNTLLNDLPKMITEGDTHLKTFVNVYKLSKKNKSYDFSQNYASLATVIEKCIQYKAGIIFFCVVGLIVNTNPYTNKIICSIREILESVDEKEDLDCAVFFINFINLFDENTCSNFGENISLIGNSLDELIEEMKKLT
jgi:hypothetical protein